jgi:hypothetical protein
MPEVMDTWIQALVKHRRAILEIDRGTDTREETGGDPVDGVDPVLAYLRAPRGG